MKVNEDPRISINKLGEYIYATPGRKKRILMEAKFPSEVIVTRYAPVQNAAIKYFTASEKDIQIFNRVKEILLQKPTLNKHQKEKIQSCIEALTHLSDCATSNLVPYHDYPAMKGYSDCKSINVRGVIVSLRPEILLLDKTTNQPQGAIKLAFSKGHFLTIQEGQCISGLIKAYLERGLKIKTHYKNFLVLDVFSNRIIYAPTKSDWTISKIETACDDIKSVWPSLQKKVA